MLCRPISRARGPECCRAAGWGRQVAPGSAQGSTCRGPPPAPHPPTTHTHYHTHTHTLPLQARKKVLRQLGYLDHQGVVTLKVGGGQGATQAVGG